VHGWEDDPQKDLPRIRAVNRRGMAMIFTGERHYRH